MDGLAPGAVIGKYRLIGLLGRGGMGEVWSAHDPDLDRRVAVKLLRPALASDDDARARLQREGRAMARLRHRNVITVHDAAFLDGRGLIAMELIDGESLAAWLVKRRPAAEVVRVLVDAGRGLAAAHAAGMIHRDFKPHNVLIERDGRVVVTDFGLARASEMRDETGTGTGTETGAETETEAGAETETETEAGAEAGAYAATAAPAALDATAAAASGKPTNPALDATATPVGLDATAAATPAPSRARSSRGDLGTPLTQTGALLGTPAYMAPEQLRGEPADARSDQYAFAVTAWEAFTGARPFTGKNFAELATAVARGEPGEATGIPRRLRPILLRAMARDPVARYATIDDLLAAITRAWRRPRRLAIAAGALGTVAAVATIVVATRGGTTTVIAGCGDPDAAVASAWSPTIRAGVRQAAEALPNRDDVLAFFDDWSDRWRATYRDNCAKPSAPDFAARRACLESVRDELGPVLAVGKDIDRAAFQIDNWTKVIANPNQCLRDPRGFPPAPPVDPQVRAAVGRIRARLLAARAFLVVRKLEPSAAAKLMADAVATGYAPVIAESNLLVTLVGVQTNPGGTTLATCATLHDAYQQADRADVQRTAIEALLLEAECTFKVDTDAGTTNFDNFAPLVNQLDVLVDRAGTDYQRAEAAMLAFELAYLTGKWNAAIEAGERQVEVLAGIGVNTGSAGLFVATALIRRHRGDDLARAERYLRARIADHPNDKQPAADLRWLLWREGRIAEAPPMPDGIADLDLVGAIPIDVRVVDSTGPVAGVAIAAANLLHSDATRIGMEDTDAPVTATTGADGTARITIPPGAIIAARRGETTGATIAPVHGAATIHLAPAASAVGTLAGQQPYPELDPTDPSARAAARTLATAVLTTNVNGVPLDYLVPVAVDGSWQLPSVLVPGHYSLSIQARSALGEDSSVQAPVELRAGTNTAPTLTVPAQPRVLEVVLRGGPVGYAVGFSGPGTAPRGWKELTPALAASTAVSMATLLPAAVLDRDTHPGDRISRLALGDGPAIACVVTGAYALEGVALYRALEPDDALVAPKVACAAVTPAEPVTRVVLTLPP